eukprot:Gregarina_sp_Poly_1__4526@NODE_242_length_10830_cov_108_673047_g213_i0_p2_GENE_NODE_242_length_10830_cov_108_673047_g213_i0NODE_242_length_10830_cov_108_673047_g213_i0_p2_ORF_typecomplete_len712_score57_00Zona_pellucida/PF00100_23/2_8e11_NODE_242_length_10830_cov_108_673047_g213_i0851610651
MGVAVPTRKRYTKHLPSNSIVKETSEGPFYIFPPDKSLWISSPSPSEYCRSGSVPIFFKGKKRKRSAAFLGETRVDSCGTSVVEAGNRIFYSNIFSPRNGPAVLVTCTCDRVKSGHCLPAARWLYYHELEKFHHEQTANLPSTPDVLGFILPVRSLVGAQNNIQIISVGDRYVFQFQINPKNQSDRVGTPWPKSCVAIDNSNTIQSLIIAGCPVSKELDLQVHVSSDPYSTIISTEPFGFASSQNGNQMRIQCEIDILSIRAQEALAFCGNSKDSFVRTSQQQQLLVMPTAIPEDPPLSTAAAPIAQSVPRRMLGNAPPLPAKKHLRAPIMNASPLHAATSNSLGGEDKALELLKNNEIETRSRLKALHQAFEDGEFGDIREAIVKAEYIGSTKSEDITRTTEQLLLDPRPLTSDRIIPQIFNQYVVGPWAVQWGANSLRQATEVAVANPGGYGFGGLSRGGRTGFFGVGTRGNNLQVSFDEPEQRVSVGVARKRYGVTVDRSDLERSTATEVRARGTDVMTVVDFLDRVVGQRVGIRNTGIQMRVDVDDIIDESDLDFGNEFYFQYKAVAVGLGLDFLDARYIIGIGMMGVNVAVARDFNAYATNLQVNWGRGWQVFLEADFPDDIDGGIQEAVGIGKPGRMYIAVGAGVGPDGIPVFERAGQRITQFSLTAGRFTYLLILFDSFVFDDAYSLVAMKQFPYGCPSNHISE